MADKPEGVPMDNLPSEQKQDQQHSSGEHSSKQGDAHAHHKKLHHGHGALGLGVLHKPEGILTNFHLAPKLFFLVNIILLALTAQVFQKVVFATPEAGAAGSFCSIDADCNNFTCSVSTCDTTSGTCTQATPQNNGQPCAFDVAGFACYAGSCMSTTDPCFGRGCGSPPDTQCTVAGSGHCADGGACQWDNVASGTRCFAPGVAHTGKPVFAGWRCDQGLCESPTTRSLANWAYMASIQAGIIGSALALEIILTGDFTPDLAALSINAGLIVIGFDGRFQDIGLERDNALGRTQVAFGWIAGGFAVILGGWLLGTKMQEVSLKNRVFSYLLVALWLIAFGTVCEVIAETFEHFDNGEVDLGANEVYNWAYPATIFAASVNIAVAHATLSTNTYTAGFSLFAGLTGLIALAWASTHVKQDVYGESETQGSNDFGESVRAWQSWAIIAGAVSIILGLVMALTAPKPQSNGEQPKRKMGFVFVALLLLLTFCTLVGIVAGLFDNHFFDRDESVYGNDMRAYERDDANNFANDVSPFSWDFSIWTSAVGAAFALSLLTNSHGMNGIAALTVTQAANLVGWAAKTANTGSQDPTQDQLEPESRAWSAIALVGGIISFLIALTILRSGRTEGGAAVAPDKPIQADDFASK